MWPRWPPSHSGTAPDVQRAAAALLIAVGGDATLTTGHDQLAPAVQAELGITADTPAAVDRVLASTPVWHSSDVPAEEVVERTAALLESAADPIELELVLRALAGLPDPVALRPLAKRARTVLDRGPREGVTHGWLRGHIARLVLMAGGERMPALPAPTRRAAFLAERLDAVAAVLGGEATPVELVATPTLSNGWISAAELVARIERSQHTPTADLVAGLLRLAPDGRDEAREAVTRSDELGDAVRYALGGPPPGPSRLPGRGVRLRQHDLWVAASRARAPREDDHLLIAAGLGAAGQGRPVRPEPSVAGEQYTWTDPGGGHASVRWTYDLTVPASADRDLLLQPTLARSQSHRGWPPEELEDWVAWLGLVTPRDTETTLTELFWPVMIAVEGFSVVHDATRVLTMLADHPGATGPLTAATLAAGLSARRVDQRVLAVDAVAVLASRGHLSSAQLARGMATVAALCQLPRWSNALAQVVPVTTKSFAFDTIVELLPTIDPGTRGLHTLLEVLLDEAARLNRRMDDARVREWLAAVTGTGKGPTTARALLAR